MRSLQFAAMLYHHQPAGLVEAARAADDMRKQGEVVPPDLRERLWSSVYLDALLSRDRHDAFVDALRNGPAPADAAATFLWLYPEKDVRDDRRALWQLFMASLEEAAGDRTSARRRFESLRDELKRERASGRILDETAAALKRLQGP